MSLLCQVVHMPVVCNDRCPFVLLINKIPMVLFVQIIIEIPQLLDAVADVPVVRVVQVLTGAVVEETVELPRLRSLRNLSSGAAHHRVDELTG